MSDAIPALSASSPSSSLSSSPPPPADRSTDVPADATPVAAVGDPRPAGSDASPTLAVQFEAYATRVIAPDDQVLFREAVRCVGADALRAAYVMTWISAAESLKRKFRELAERDKKAAGVLQKVTDAEAQHQAVDTRLLNEAKAYGFISDAEHAQLLHVYQMRSVFAHPYEQAPTPEALLAAARTVVDAVLSRPTKLRHGFIADRVALLAGDPNFLDDVRTVVAEFAEEMFGRVAEDLHPYLLAKLWDALTPKVADPTAQLLVRRGRRFTLAYLGLGGEALIKRIDWSIGLPPHARLLAPVLADLSLFPHLSKIARDMVVAHVVDIAGGNATYLAVFDGLLDADHLDDRQRERVAAALDAVPLKDLAETAVAPARYVGRVIAEMKRHNWYAQNDAVAVLRNIGPGRVAGLPAAAQRELGNNVLQSADGSARDAQAFLRTLASRTPDEVWPPEFLAGVVAECFLNDEGAVRFKTGWMEEALTTLVHVPEPRRVEILHEVAAAVEGGQLAKSLWDLDEFDTVVDVIDGLGDEALRESPPMQRLRQALVARRVRETAAETAMEAAKEAVNTGATQPAGGGTTGSTTAGSTDDAATP